MCEVRSLTRSPLPFTCCDFTCGHSLGDLLARHSSKGPLHDSSHSVHSFSGDHCVLVVVQLLIKMGANPAMLLHTVVCVGSMWTHVIEQILISLNSLCTCAMNFGQLLLVPTYKLLVQ